MSFIIINQQKHDTYYFSALTEQEKKDSLLKIYENNKNMQYYDDFIDSNYKQRLDYLKNNVLKNEELSKVLKKYDKDDFSRIQELILNYKKQAQEFIEQKKVYDLCEKGDIKAIERFLKMRSHLRYEGFEIVRLS